MAGLRRKQSEKRKKHRKKKKTKGEEKEEENLRKKKNLGVEHFGQNKTEQNKNENEFPFVMCSKQLKAWTLISLPAATPLQDPPPSLLTTPIPLLRVATRQRRTTDTFTRDCFAAGWHLHKGGGETETGSEVAPVCGWRSKVSQESRHLRQIYILHQTHQTTRTSSIYIYIFLSLHLTSVDLSGSVSEVKTSTK